MNFLLIAHICKSNHYLFPEIQNYRIDPEKLEDSLSKNVITSSFEEETITTRQNMQYKLHERIPVPVLTQQITSVFRSSLSTVCS